MGDFYPHVPAWPWLVLTQQSRTSFTGLPICRPSSSDDTLGLKCIMLTSSGLIMIVILKRGFGSG